MLDTNTLVAAQVTKPISAGIAENSSGSRSNCPDQTSAGQSAERRRWLRRRLGACQEISSGQDWWVRRN